MKKVLLLSVLLYLLSSCTQETYYPKNDNSAIIITVEKPHGSYKYAYTFKGQKTWSENNQKQIVANYKIAELFTNYNFSVNDNIFGRISKSDSIVFIKRVIQTY